MLQSRALKMLHFHSTDSFYFLVLSKEVINTNCIFYHLFVNIVIFLLVPGKVAQVVLISNQFTTPSPVLLVIIC